MPDIYAAQPGIIWTITLGVDLTGADTVVVFTRAKEDKSGPYSQFTATGTTTGCTLTTTTSTFPVMGTYIFQVVASFSNPLKEFISDEATVNVGRRPQ